MLLGARLKHISTLILIILILSGVLGNTLSAISRPESNEITGEGIKIDLYSPGESFNISEYDIIVGLKNTSSIPGYTFIAMNYGGLLMYLVLNPVPPKNNGFSPFTIRSVRNLFNRLIDRRVIEREATEYMGRATEIPAAPGSPDYNLVRDIVGIYESISIDRLWDKMRRDLIEAGARYNESDGYWYYNGSIVTVRLVHRPMDSLAEKVMEHVADIIEEMGFRAEIVNASYIDYLNYIFTSDPSLHEWDILQMYCSIRTFKYGILPAYLYSSWKYFITPPVIYLPRGGDKTYINTTINYYVGELLENPRGSREWISAFRHLVYLGLSESVTIPLVYLPTLVAVRENISDKITISPVDGVFTPELINIFNGLRIAIITGSELVDPVHPLTIYSHPSLLPHYILLKFTSAEPYIYDPDYGDPIGYGLDYFGYGTTGETNAYILNYTTRTWSETTIPNGSKKIVIYPGNLRDPIDNRAPLTTAKVLFSIYVAEYISNNPAFFPHTYREYREALEGLLGIRITGYNIVFYYTANTSLVEVMDSVATILRPALSPIGLMIPIVYEDPGSVLSGYNPWGVNLLSKDDSNMTAEFLSLIDANATYEAYSGIFRLGSYLYLDRDEWVASINGVINWIKEHGVAWISNGRFYIVNITDRSVSLAPRNIDLEPHIITYYPISPPRLAGVMVVPWIKNDTVYPKVIAYVSNDYPRVYVFPDYVIGCIYTYNGYPVEINSSIPRVLMFGHNKYTFTGNPGMVYTDIRVSLIEYSWLNRSSSTTVSIHPSLKWVNATSATCASTTCTYRILVVQNTSSVLRILFNNETIEEADLPSVYGVLYDVKINTSRLSDGEYTLEARLLIDNTVVDSIRTNIRVDVDPPSIQAVVDVYGNQTVRITWNIRDFSGISSVHIEIKGPRHYMYSVGPTGNLDLYLVPGNYTIVFKAVDSYGHVSVISKVFEIRRAITAANETTSPSPAPGPIETGFPTYLAIGIVIVVVAVFILILYIRRRAKT